MIVTDKNGLQGAITQDERSSFSFDNELLVHFQNGQQVAVPRELLVCHHDGRYSLPVSIEELSVAQAKGRYIDMHNYDVAAAMEEQSFVIPVIAEELNVQKRIVETGVTQLRKTVHEHTELVDEALRSEEVEIKRVAINRVVDEAPGIRHEGDTMIIPLLEEVLVVEKRLMLREEVHIKRVHKEMHKPQEVLLREERVEVVRKPNAGQGIRQEEPQGTPRQ